MEPPFTPNYELALMDTAEEVLQLISNDDSSSLENTFDHALLGSVQIMREYSGEMPYLLVSESIAIRCMYDSMSIRVVPEDKTQGRFMLERKRGQRHYKVLTGGSLVCEYVSSAGRLSPYVYLNPESIDDESIYNTITSSANLEQTCRNIGIPYHIHWNDLCKKVLDIINPIRVYELENDCTEFTEIADEPNIDEFTDEIDFAEFIDDPEDADVNSANTWTIHASNEIAMDLLCGLVDTFICVNQGRIYMALPGDFLDINSPAHRGLFNIIECNTVDCYDDYESANLLGLYGNISNHQTIPKNNSLIIMRLKIVNTTNSIA